MERDGSEARGASRFMGHAATVARKRSPDERSDIRDSSLLNPVTLIEFEHVAVLKAAGQRARL